MRMNEEKIVDLALKHFLPYSQSCGKEDDLQWWGKHENLLSFAQELYEEGYDDGCYEATGGQ